MHAQYICNGPAISVEGEYVGRQDCGADLTEQVLAIPEDGREHVVTCPCGRLQYRVQRMPASAP